MDPRSILAQKKYLGKTFNNLQVIEYIPKNKTRPYQQVKVKCLHCGSISIKKTWNLKHTYSCGCKTIELLKQANITHGFAKPKRGKARPEYGIWARAKSVGVVAAWKNFTRFISDMGVRPTDGKFSLKRKNPKLLFGPKNCYWKLIGKKF